MCHSTLIRHAGFISASPASLLSNVKCYYSCMNHHYYVYIMCNDYNSVFYIGVTNNIERRVLDHRNKLNDGFTAKYNVRK